MEKQKINREIVHIISRHSNWQSIDVENVFKEQGIYAGRWQWIGFLNLLLPGLGVSLMLSGVIFFFAYNWAAMHKFVKLGIVEAGIAACIVVTLLPRAPELIKNIALAAASVLVGALFAVFGQIYQTGADAYDFFWGWTMFVALWVLVSGFAPLWLLGLALVNTSMILYAGQVAEDWSGQTVYNLLFIINALAVIIVEVRSHNAEIDKRPKWFVQTAAIAAIVVITISIVFSIYSSANMAGIASFLLGVAGLSIGMFYGFKTKSIFYISSVSFSVIVIICALIIKPFQHPIGIFFIVTIFLIASTTSLIFKLIQLSKQWHGNNQPN
jgi:uncharacterized membrane protein